MNITKGNEHTEEFRQPTFPQLLQTLAHLQRDCPECGGSGEVPCRCVFDSTPHNMDKCPNCIDGKVFVLPEMVRVPNPGCGGSCSDWEVDCPVAATCEAYPLGTAASQDMEGWLLAAAELWGRFTLRWYPWPREVWVALPTLGKFEPQPAPDPFTALILAIQKAVGKEKDG